MNRKVVQTEYSLCTCCMEEHNIDTVTVQEKTTFKNTPLSYDATYCYCANADEYYANEKQLRENDMRLKDAYRKHEGLLTSAQIRKIRLQYGISQGDLCALLGWGAKTITRYESHQVQDRAHNAILKKLSEDPEWFLSLLQDAKAALSADAYRKCFEKAMQQYHAARKVYLQKAVRASYAKYADIVS